MECTPGNAGGAQRKTWVVVEMSPVEAHKTHVTLTHLGWKNGPEWDRAYVHFERGWSEL